MLRPAVVAGRFYPAEESRLRGYLKGLSRPVHPMAALGVLAPHAGYIYSGRAAGETLGAVRIPDTVLLLGPNHTGRGTPASIMGSGAWRTPLGDVAIDAALAGALKAACPQLVEDHTAHDQEHSLEVMLPFLQYANPAVTIVPIAFMLRSAKTIEEVGRCVGRTLKEYGREVLIVASSDMTHYESAEEAREKDMAALERIVALDPAGLLATVFGNGITMCGVVPAAVMLWATRELGANRARLTVYTNSGEVSGDTSSVVGYAGVVVTHEG